MNPTEQIKSLKAHIANCENTKSMGIRIWKTELISIVDVLESLKCCGNCGITFSERLENIKCCCCVKDSSYSSKAVMTEREWLDHWTPKEEIK
jgi:hypothetical protein